MVSEWPIRRIEMGDLIILDEGLAFADGIVEINQPTFTSQDINGKCIDQFYDSLG